MAVKEWESRIDELKTEKLGKGMFALVINRPEKRNAINGDMGEEMVRILRALESAEKCRVVILRGEGKIFCAGGDMNAAVTATTAEEGRDLMRMYGNLIRTMQQMDKPIIAQVHGAAIGAGMSLALAADLIYAAEGTYFMSNFNHLGVPPECGALAFLPQTVGVYRAKELWYTSKKIDAAEAESKYGFVSQVLPAEELSDKVMEIANLISSLPSCGVRVTKKLTNDYTFPMLNAILDSEQQNTPLCVTSEESQALFMKFLEKKQDKPQA